MGNGAGSVKSLSPSIEPPDSHYLSSAVGWMELGNLTEANLELERLSPAVWQHPEVLEVKWLLDSKAERWDCCLKWAESLLNVAPENPTGWIHRAYALRRVGGGGLTSAFEALLPAVEKFPQEAVIPYNLACYLCRMGRMEECRHFLEISFKRGNSKAMKKMALQDEDLKELWPELQGSKGQT